ncbi:DEAD/DEAH box helicase [Paraclostridium bifermentans]|uniref:DEAD/DEAH box helicase n=1 Tax=Paraclostridium bifermentans TaxID=1490 RepID=A0A5P3XCT4_PARBF|nr:DEAD/DEAH box helicase family protein [Paraclostridium bifermentans]QEZ68492.1 DEAD/DEAH box helicase [Paraclostridium bifermentans]
MVDFKRRIKSKKNENKVHPCEIYETLDRKSDKGPLRSVQAEILNDWYDNYKDNKDVILKLHTGQGKTLIGLLMLQSKINEGKGPVIYLCPNNYLVEQTCLQADSFGIKYVTTNGELPYEFLEGKRILITTINKLFNGITKFGLESRSEKVDTILMDDSHACINEIIKSCTMEFNSESDVYKHILNLFFDELKSQGAGSFRDICDGDKNEVLPIPYWAWQDKIEDVTDLLCKNKDEIKFTWPILKNILKDCRCIISGNKLEISPYITPLYMFGSYYNANHRILMSATISDDSFLINTLGISKEHILNPLKPKNEKWSGEKMIIIPSLIDESLDRKKIIRSISVSESKNNYGVVALVPSYNRAKDWDAYNKNKLTSRADISEAIENLKSGNYEKNIVIANRYDGVDLPDDACRILIIDSKPVAQTLNDRYIEDCISNSDIISIKTAQTIEQGIGRSVRGEKDYCAIILIDSNLINFIRNPRTKEYFSNQTRKQIELGINISEYAKEELDEGMEPIDSLNKLVKQLLGRDPDWKEYYIEEMNDMDNGTTIQSKMIDVLELERQAGELYLKGDVEKAASTIQNLIDNCGVDDNTKGWYLQEKARILYSKSKSDSNKAQLSAYNKNSYLMKPREGSKVAKLKISAKRIDKIIENISEFENFQDLNIYIDSILSNLIFGISSEKFESSLDKLGKLLGFNSERPDKKWKEGPDNLWSMENNEYVLIECKNEVNLNRDKISQREVGQMNNSCAWFKNNYGDAKVCRFMIIPTNIFDKAVGFNEDVKIITPKELDSLKRNVRAFFKEFSTLNLKNLSKSDIQKYINNHKLDADSISKKYGEEPIEG